MRRFLIGKNFLAESAIGMWPNREKSVSEKAVYQDVAARNTRFALCLALVLANPLCGARWKRTMRDTEVQLGNPG
jgi:hypothetical protein